jgi:hypothetical protein
MASATPDFDKIHKIRRFILKILVRIPVRKGGCVLSQKLYFFLPLNGLYLYFFLSLNGYYIPIFTQELYFSKMLVEINRHVRSLCNKCECVTSIYFLSPFLTSCTLPMCLCSPLLKAKYLPYLSQRNVMPLWTFWLWWYLVDLHTNVISQISHLKFFHPISSPL